MALVRPRTPTRLAQRPQARGGQRGSLEHGPRPLIASRPKFHRFPRLRQRQPARAPWLEQSVLLRKSRTSGASRTCCTRSLSSFRLVKGSSSSGVSLGTAGPTSSIAAPYPRPRSLSSDRRSKVKSSTGRLSVSSMMIRSAGSTEGGALFLKDVECQRIEQDVQWKIHRHPQITPCQEWTRQITKGTCGH